MVEYVEVLKKSWKEIWKNPILFLPKFLSLIFSIILLWIFLNQFNLYNLLIESKFSYDTLIGLLLYPFLKPSYLIFVFLYVILETSILAFFSGMGFGMYKDIVQKKNTNISKGIDYGKKYFIKIIGISIIYYILIAVPIYVAYNFIVGPFFINKTIHYTIGIFIGLWFLFWIFLVVLRMLFVYAAMVFKKRDTLKTIEIGAHFGKIYFKHTLVVWSIVFGIGFLFSSIRGPITYGSDSFEGLAWIVVFLIAFAILDIILYVWEHVFIFNSFLDKKM
jgi:hypothetical protein